MKNYSDIINLPRPISTNHPPMSRDKRAAQFAPYAALVGHKDIITQNEIDNLNSDDAQYQIVLDEEYQNLPPDS